MKIVQSIEANTQDDVTVEELADLMVLFWCDGFYGVEDSKGEGGSGNKGEGSVIKHK
jgi:hypothetical protein